MSGGLFFAIGLIHILPEAHSKLEGSIESTTNTHGHEPLPISYVICLATFSVILLIDKVIMRSFQTEESARQSRQIAEGTNNEHDRHDHDEYNKIQEHIELVDNKGGFNTPSRNNKPVQALTYDPEALSQPTAVLNTTVDNKPLLHSEEHLPCLLYTSPSPRDT